MPKKDPRIDAVIRESAPFAKPILTHIRKVIHKYCPRVEETIKWGMPHFLYDGKMLCGMGPFKEHCRFGFWNGSQIVNPDGSKAKIGMGDNDALTSLKDLPSEKLLASYIKQAMKLAESGASPMKGRVAKKAPVRTPPDFLRALKANRKAFDHYQAFSPSHKREYVEWIAGAKTEATRESRLETAVDWIARGKSRNWKYR
jgi:uncharacterized protein YdeI (YjbR/CyaY-like superfamily)